MQLGVLVDRTVDAHEQAVRLEIGEMLLEIEPRAVLQADAMRGGGLIEHVGTSVASVAAQPTTIRQHQLLDLRDRDALRSRPLPAFSPLEQRIPMVAQ